MHDAVAFIYPRKLNALKATHRTMYLRLRVINTRVVVKSQDNCTVRPRKHFTSQLMMTLLSS